MYGASKIMALTVILEMCVSCATQKVSVSPSLHKFQAVGSVSDGYTLLYIQKKRQPFGRRPITTQSMVKKVFLEAV